MKMEKNKEFFLHFSKMEIVTEMKNSFANLEEKREKLLFSILWKQFLQKGIFSFLHILRKKGKKPYFLQEGKKALKKGNSFPLFSAAFCRPTFGNENYERN